MADFQMPLFFQRLTEEQLRAMSVLDRLLLYLGCVVDNDTMQWHITITDAAEALRCGRRSLGEALATAERVQFVTDVALTGRGWTGQLAQCYGFKAAGLHWAVQMYVDTFGHKPSYEGAALISAVTDRTAWHAVMQLWQANPKWSHWKVDWMLNKYHAALVLGGNLPNKGGQEQKGAEQQKPKGLRED